MRNERLSKVRKAADAVNKTDRTVTHRAAAGRGHPLIKAIGAVSEAADQPPLIALGIGTALLGAVLRNPVILRSGVRMLAAEVIATGIKSAIKHRVDRTRPEKAMKRGAHRFARGDSHEHDENSFPSGHTAGAVAVARAVAHEQPGVALPAYAMATAVGAAQIPRGKHYVLDALVGAAIGYVAEAGAAVLLRGGGRLWRAAARPHRTGVNARVR